MDASNRIQRNSIPNRCRLKSGYGWIQQLVCSLRSKYRERWVRKQTDLLEHRRLVPVNTLVCELAVAKSDDRDKWNLDPAAGWWNPREHPRHLCRVGEGEDDLVHQSILTQGTGNQLDRRVRRHRRDEVFLIKPAQGFVAVATSHNRNVVDRSEALIRAPRFLAAAINCRLRICRMKL